MKLKLVTASLMVILALFLLACSTSAPGTVTWEVPIENFANQQHFDTDEVIVPAGDTLTLVLGSNPTTGFSWSETAQISDETVLKQIGHEFIGPESETPPPPGSPGKETWKFQALKEGTSTVYMEYSRPWEGGEKAEWTYKLNVTVE